MTKLLKFRPYSTDFSKLKTNLQVIIQKIKIMAFPPSFSLPIPSMREDPRGYSSSLDKN